MHKILEKRQYSPDVFYLKVEAPEIAKNRHPGQFVIVQINTDFGERVPPYWGPWAVRLISKKAVR